MLVTLDAIQVVAEPLTERMRSEPFAEIEMSCDWPSSRFATSAPSSLSDGGARAPPDVISEPEPAPVTGTTTSPSGSLLANVSVPATAPAPVGVIATAIVAFAPGASVSGASVATV